MACGQVLSIHRCNASPGDASTRVPTPLACLPPVLVPHAVSLLSPHLAPSIDELRVGYYFLEAFVVSPKELQRICSFFRSLRCRPRTCSSSFVFCLAVWFPKRLSGVPTCGSSGYGVDVPSIGGGEAKKTAIVDKVIQP